MKEGEEEKIKDHIDVEKRWFPVFFGRARAARWRVREVSPCWNGLMKEQEASAHRQAGSASRITPAECKDDFTIQSIWITFEPPSTCKTTDILK